MIHSEWKIGVRFPEIMDISILDQDLGLPDILSFVIGAISADADLRFVNLTGKLQLMMGLEITRSCFYTAAYNCILFASLFGQRK